MKRYKINPELKKILKKEGVYNLFVANVENKVTNPLMLDDYITYNIMYAFIWDRTPEGPDFWKNLDDKYSKPTKVS